MICLTNTLCFFKSRSDTSTKESHTLRWRRMIGFLWEPLSQKTNHPAPPQRVGFFCGWIWVDVAKFFIYIDYKTWKLTYVHINWGRLILWSTNCLCKKGRVKIGSWRSLIIESLVDHCTYVHFNLFDHKHLYKQIITTEVYLWNIFMTAILLIWHVTKQHLTTR